MRRHPRYAEVDATAPSGWGTCEACGFVWNLRNLKWRTDWRGLRIENLRHLVCEICLDVPQRQLGSIILTPDPLPLLNARPEQYDIDEEPVSVLTTEGGASLVASGYPAPSLPLLIVTVPGTPNNTP